jgi:hypothetical protein
MQYPLPYILLVLTGAIALFGVMMLWVPGRVGRSMGFYLLLGTGLQFLLTLPVGLIQGALIMGPRTTVSEKSPLQPGESGPSEGGTAPSGRIASQPPPMRMALALAAMPIQMGGFTTRLAFEAVDGPLRRPDRGYPSSALAGGINLTAIAVLQVLGISAILGTWLRAHGQLRDHRILALGGFVCLNSLINLTWPWWGS